MTPSPLVKFRESNSMSEMIKTEIQLYIIGSLMIGFCFGVMCTA